MLFGLGGLILLFVPFVDRNTSAGTGFTVAGLVITTYVVGMTAWGYRSFLPILIAIATLLVIFLFGYPQRRSRKKGE